MTVVKNLHEPVVLGWREWVALPDLNIPAIKAKVDSGAKTSALHAFDVQPVGHGRVRFLMHPLQRNTELVVACETDIVDQRKVTDSGGHSELRYVVASTLELGGRQWPIEITLTSRDNMRFRMLLGRQALAGHGLIDPQRSFCLPKVSIRQARVLYAAEE
jgi:ribosomal protein S6--L-glutamate ligase